MSDTPPSSFADAASLCRRYVRNPAEFSATPRQARKLAARLANVGQDPALAVETALKIGYARADRAAPTVFICNVGSSGSHWLQGLLSQTLGYLPCGEIYFPDDLLAALPEDAREKRAFIQTIYAIHAWHSKKDLHRAGAINTAHKADPSRLRRHEGEGFAILLKRDPLAVVLSRTFRKDEYRQDLNKHTVSDHDYLMDNVRFVRNFYRQAARFDYDATVRYEDLLNDAAGTIARILTCMKAQVPYETVEAIAKRFSETSAARRAAAHDKTIAPPAPEFVELAGNQLDDVRGMFGYS